MQRRELVQGYELKLYGWGLGALVIAVLLRVGFGWLSARQFWLLDSQLLLVPLFVAVAVCAGLIIRGQYSRASTAVLGLLAWAMALSLIPWPRDLRYLWWQVPGLRQQLPDWLAWAGVAVLLISLATRAAMTRTWLAQLRGHGYEWIRGWAAGKPYFARLLALRVLRSLGYAG